MAAGLEAGQQLVQQHQLAGRANQGLQVEVWGHGVIHLPQLRYDLLLSAWTRETFISPS